MSLHNSRHIATLGLALLTLFASQKLHAQTDLIRLDHVSCLTSNLDSLTRFYATNGFAVEMGPHDPTGLESNIVHFATGQFLSLQSTRSDDSSDWRVESVAAFGTHISGVTFTVRDAGELSRRFDSLRIPHSELLPGNSESRMFHGFGLNAPAPIDVSFISLDSGEMRDTTYAVGQNGLSRITWLLFTASPRVQNTLRSVFAGLGLTTHHEGCCDYWVIGPPEARVGIRFEFALPAFALEGDWLSIEEGGLVFNY